ncbi:DUF1177 domain-containing protein [Aliivibrio fischeri]|uniref:DUF1177 domain-containing protein n=1 Tax=Aliivibrio fischeri TaxID=668 RepID=UPI0012DA2D61|nr:DUF1177 domain-containing protein [Aliivibrio fischeri]MUK68923.1 DUF1177 family protein [Aliivibrio fischeri]MUK73380.1 DUF1177 family protein [Aliivibrio fischeri]
MLKQVIDLYELLDSPNASGEIVSQYLCSSGGTLEQIEIDKVTSEKGETDFIKIIIPGLNGKTAGGTAPTLGIIGRLGGIGARPEITSFVSDGDGALAALAAAAKLLKMMSNGDQLEGDTIITTHICPNAPTREHHPVPFMDSPISFEDTWKFEVDPSMDAIISIDTTKGNRIMNYRGIAISPTVCQGYILKVSNTIIDIVERTTGNKANVFPLSIQDITPYGNGLHHLNSILQPSVATDVPVVGIALCASIPVAGCATGASHEVDIEQAARFSIEAARDFGQGTLSFVDDTEFALIKKLYGSQSHFQTRGI